MAFEFRFSTDRGSTTLGCGSDQLEQVRQPLCESVPQCSKVRRPQRGRVMGPQCGRVMGLMAVVVVGLIGCGGDTVQLPRAAVQGTVMLNGQPLTDAVIRFIPTGDTQGPATSISIVEGQFEADEQVGPIIGQHRIEIQSNDDGGFAFDDEQALERLKQNPQRIRVQEIPDSYNTHSVLLETVEADAENKYKFELKSSTKTSRRS